MPVLIVFITLVSAICAAPPAPPGYYDQAQFQQINPLDYYVGPHEIGGFYNQLQQKRGSDTANEESPSRLETMDPDSEVELLPGAQQPQQPPQQSPVAPNVPGLLPGQRVYIVHMPVPGIRPGTVGGYQPVYIIASAPQGNNAFPGYQNPILLDPSGQVPRGLVYQSPGYQGSPNVLQLGASPLQRPFAFAYQNPAYQPVQVDGAHVGLNQFVALQGLPQTAAAVPNEVQNLKQKSNQLREDTKEDYEEQNNAQITPNKRPKL